MRPAAGAVRPVRAACFLPVASEYKKFALPFLAVSRPHLVLGYGSLGMLMPQLLLFVSSLILLLSLFAAPSFAFSATNNIMTPSSTKAIETKDAPAPVGPYSQAVLTGNTLYVSGQVAIDPASGEMVRGGDVEAETRQVLKNMDAVLKEAGATSHNVVRTTVFLADLGDFAKVNALYAEYFDGPVSPARACVQVAALPKAARVEIDCIAIL